MSLSGAWTVKVDHERTPDPFELRVVENSGHVLTGTMGIQGDASSFVPISNGRVSGTTASWDVKVLGFKSEFSGHIHENRIHGRVKVPAFDIDVAFEATRISATAPVG